MDNTILGNIYICIMYRYEDYDYYKDINKKISSEEYLIYKYF